MEAVQVISAILVAVFTGMLWFSTKRLGDLQARMNELQASQLRLQEKLADIQEQFAKADLQPRINVSVDGSKGFGIRLTNLGKYGVQIKHLRRHRELPEAPGTGGQDLSPCLGCPSLPIALTQGDSEVLPVPKSDERQEMKYLEVLYTHGANPGILFSDLWRFEYAPRSPEYQSRFIQAWSAEKVQGKESA